MEDKEQLLIPAHKFTCEGTAKECLEQVKALLAKKYGSVDHFRITVRPFKGFDEAIFYKPDDVVKIKPRHTSTLLGAHTFLISSCNQTKGITSYRGWINSDRSKPLQTFFEHDLEPI